MPQAVYTRPGQSIETPVNEEFTISLDSLEQLNCAWRLEPDYDAGLLELLEEQQKHWKFRARSAGSTTVTFSQQRTGEDLDAVSTQTLAQFFISAL